MVSLCTQSLEHSPKAGGWTDIQTVGVTPESTTGRGDECNTDNLTHDWSERRQTQGHTLMIPLRRQLEKAGTESGCQEELGWGEGRTTEGPCKGNLG